MGYQFADGFDNYDTTAIRAAEMWETVSGSPTISSSYARFPAVGSYPNQGVKLASGGGYIRKNLNSNQGNLIAFMSYGGALPASGTLSFLQFQNAGVAQCSLGVTSAGALVFYQSNGAGGGILLASSSPGLLSTTTVPSHGIEIQVTFSATIGRVQVWLDGTVVIPLTTGLNTIAAFGSAYANQVKVGYCYGTGADVYTDYVRVWDNTGSYQNSPLGYDCRKLTKLPTGAGHYSNWTPLAGSNYQNVNDNPPDADTSYNSSTTGATVDSYAMGAASLTIPSMVVAIARIRKDDTATRTAQVGIRSVGGNDSISANVHAAGSTYAFISDCISLDPDTSLPPTGAAADAFQFEISGG